MIVWEISACKNVNLEDRRTSEDDVFTNFLINSRMRNLRLTAFSGELPRCDRSVRKLDGKVVQ